MSPIAADPDAVLAAIFALDPSVSVAVATLAGTTLQAAEASAEGPATEGEPLDESRPGWRLPFLELFFRFFPALD